MEHREFKLHAPFSPTGDQPEAIEKLTEGVLDGIRTQVLVGVDVHDGKRHQKRGTAHARHRAQ